MKVFLITILIFWVVSRMLKKNVYINTFNSFQQPPGTDNAAPRRPEGEMTIEKKAHTGPGKKKKDQEDEGEFVAYTEVK